MVKNKNGIEINESISWKEISKGGNITVSGSANQFITGDWRVKTPKFIEEKCKQCLLCVPVCPDMAIPVVDKKRTDFDFDHCKGCGVCIKACPFDAIVFEEE